MYRKTVLNNGLRVLTAEMPHTRSVSMFVSVGAGSRYEPDELAGLSHFLEHLPFKGTRQLAHGPGNIRGSRGRRRHHETPPPTGK